MAGPSNYRQLIYDKYASCFQDAEKTFNTIAADRWSRAYDYYLRQWLPDNKDANILDIACGGGLFLHFLKTRGYINITGVDISPEQVSLAKQVTENVIEGNVLEFLETTKEKYNLITGLDIIEHLQKDEVIRLLNSIHTALKPNGRLILQTPNADSPWGMMHRYWDFTHEICFNPNSLMKLLKLVAFQNIKFREAGPVVHGIISAVRYLIWQVIRTILKVWNLAEMGGCGSCIFTRIFLISGLKK